MSDYAVFIAEIIVLLFSVIIHEIAHGAVALMFGDTTAKDAGRLTLNPLKHIDPFGSIILPAILVLSHIGVIFGWAKPVPYNPFNFRKPRLGSAVVGLAGPLTNIILAAVFAFGIYLLNAHKACFIGNGVVSAFFASVVFINLYLAFFNLIPIPPLDGSKLLFAFISDKYLGLKIFLERYGIFIFILFIFAIARFIYPLVISASDLLGAGRCIAY